MQDNHIPFSTTESRSTVDVNTLFPGIEFRFLRVLFSTDIIPNDEDLEAILRDVFMLTDKVWEESQDLHDLNQEEPPMYGLSADVFAPVAGEYVHEGLEVHSRHIDAPALRLVSDLSPGTTLLNLVHGHGRGNGYAVGNVWDEGGVNVLAVGVAQTLAHASLLCMLNSMADSIGYTSINSEFHIPLKNKIERWASSQPDPRAAMTRIYEFTGVDTEYRHHQ